MYHADPKTTVRVAWTPFDWAVELIALIGMLSLLGLLINAYPSLPDTIPTHFDASGTPDDTGSKAILFVLGGVALVLYTLISVLSRFPQIYNYPFPIEAGTEAQHFAAARGMLIRLKAMIVCMFAYICYATIETAHGRMNGLGLWFIPLMLLLIFGSIIAYVVMASRIAPPENEAAT